MYIVLELQTTNNKTAHIFWSYTDVNEAESKYHAVLSAAAVSSVEVHTAVMMDEYGQNVKSQYYVHTKKDELVEE